MSQFFVDCGSDRFRDVQPGVLHGPTYAFESRRLVYHVRVVMSESTTPTGPTESLIIVVFCMVSLDNKFDVY